MKYLLDTEGNRVYEGEKLWHYPNPERQPDLYWLGTVEDDGIGDRVVIVWEPRLRMGRSAAFSMTRWNANYMKRKVIKVRVNGKIIETERITDECGPHHRFVFV